MANLNQLVKFDDHLNPKEATELLKYDLDAYLNLVRAQYQRVQDVAAGTLVRTLTLKVQVSEHSLPCNRMAAEGVNHGVEVKVKSNATPPEVKQLIEKAIEDRKLPAEEFVLYEHYYGQGVFETGTLYEFYDLHLWLCNEDSKPRLLKVAPTADAKWNKDAEGKCEVEVHYEDIGKLYKVKVLLTTTVKEVIAMVGAQLNSKELYGYPSGSTSKLCMWIDRRCHFITRLADTDVLWEKWNPSIGSLAMDYV